MKQQLADLVGVILERLESLADTPPSETGLRNWLTGEGYKKRDIDAAMRLVLPRAYVQHGATECSPGSVRQLSPYELHKFAPEVRDALARLELHELMDVFEREVLMERLNQLEGVVTMEDLDFALSSIMCMTRDVETQQTFFDVMEDNKDSYH